MIGVDTNILVYAARADLPEHARARGLLEDLRRGEAPWAVPGDVIASFLRLVTNPRVFRAPSSLDDGLDFVRALRRSPSLLVVNPGPRHLDLFLDVCARSRARGKLVPDAWLAALAIEHGLTWWSADRDFARFDGLDWHDPFERRQV